MPRKAENMGDEVGIQDKNQRGDRPNYIGAPAFFVLNEACILINDAFGGIHCYLVGSALQHREYRDVDVRCILDDEHYDKLFPGDPNVSQRHPLWNVMCISISKMLAERTGLPIDFQIQRRTYANQKFNGPREALGLFWAVKE